jgi:hypothetical protein
MRVPKARLPPPLPPQLAEVTVTGMIIEWKSEGLVDVALTATAYDPGGAAEQPAVTVRVTGADPPDASATPIESETPVQVRP